MTSHCSPSPLHVYITHSVWIHSTWGSYTVSVEVLCPFPLSSSYVASCFSVRALPLCSCFFPHTMFKQCDISSTCHGKKKTQIF